MFLVGETSHLQRITQIMHCVDSCVAVVCTKLLVDMLIFLSPLSNYVLAK